MRDFKSIVFLAKTGQRERGGFTERRTTITKREEEEEWSGRATERARMKERESEREGGGRGGAKRKSGWKCHHTNRSLHKLNEEESRRRHSGTQHLKMLTRELKIARAKRRGNSPSSHFHKQHLNRLAGAAIQTASRT